MPISRTGGSSAYADTLSAMRLWSMLQCEHTWPRAAQPLGQAVVFTEDQGLPRAVFLPALLFCSHAHPYAPHAHFEMSITLRNADTWKHNKPFPFLHNSSTGGGRGSKSQKPSTALGGWRHLAPQRRNHGSNSLGAAAAPLQDFYVPSTMKICTEELQNWKAEQANLATGTHQSTEIWLMQFLRYQPMCVSICPRLSREALDRAWQKPPHSCPSSVKD